MSFREILRKAWFILAVMLSVCTFLIFVPFFMLLVPILWVYFKITQDILGIYRPTLSAFEWWEWEMLEGREARRRGKEALTEEDKRDLGQRVKQEMWETWHRERERLSAADTPLLRELMEIRFSPREEKEESDDTSGR